MIKCPKCSRNLNCIKDSWNKVIPNYGLCRDCQLVFKYYVRVVGNEADDATSTTDGDKDGN